MTYLLNGRHRDAAADQEQSRGQSNLRNFYRDGVGMRSAGRYVLHTAARQNKPMNHGH